MPSRPAVRRVSSPPRPRQVKRAPCALVDPRELARRLDAVPVGRGEHLAHLPAVVAPGREHRASGVQRRPVLGAPQAALYAQLRARARLGRARERERPVHVPRVQHAGRRARVTRAVRVLAHEARLDRARARAPVAVGRVPVVARLAALDRIVPAGGGPCGGAVVARLRANPRAQQRRARQQQEPRQSPAPAHAARARRGLIYLGVRRGSGCLKLTSTANSRTRHMHTDYFCGIMWSFTQVYMNLL